jgi:putative membrane protein
VQSELVEVTYGHGMGVAWVWPLILVLGLAMVVWALIRAFRANPGHASVGTGSARQILQERFARGEITEQEYRERMRVLDEH